MKTKPSINKIDGLITYLEREIKKWDEAARRCKTTSGYVVRLKFSRILKPVLRKAYQVKTKEGAHESLFT